MKLSSHKNCKPLNAYIPQRHWRNQRMSFQLKSLAVSISLLATVSLTSCFDSNNSSDPDNNNDYQANNDHFSRLATYPICAQLELGDCNVDDETAAEIVTASTDGNTLIYSNSPFESLGFVDITDPSSPVGLGELDLGGEPTSVSVYGDYAVVAVNTSEDFVNVSGQLIVVDIASQRIEAQYPLAGQPDSIAVSPSGNYIAVVIENERDEDLGDGVPPQLPAGELIIFDISADPTTWTQRTVSMTNIADLYTEDPEPEYVDINSDDVAVVTLQENNYIMLVDLASGVVTNGFSAGAVDLENIDATEEDPALISLTESQSQVLREPDGVTWISTSHFVTADEGDLDGGSRGFTIFNTDGDVVYSSGNLLDHLAVRYGHYPDDRSGNKGNEPENAEFAEFDEVPYLFVNSERSSLIFVFDVTNPEAPIYKQALPAAAGPEGVLAIPSRNLLVAASEEDDRGDKLRSGLNVYELFEDTEASYPTLESVDVDGLPIAFGALSGLAADLTEANILYSIEDSFYQSNRIFKIDTSTQPAQLVEAMPLVDANDAFANTQAADLAEDDPARDSAFDTIDLAAMINDDGTVNIDPEGVAAAADGGFWVASEGSGTIGDAGRPINSLNFIFKTDEDANIEAVYTLPQDVNDIQLRFGFEGITEYAGNVYVAFQRAWGGEENPRIGIFNPTTEEWSFIFYPLDARESQRGGWVGLSDIISVGNGEMLVLERDNQGGPDAAIKRIYSVDVTGAVDGDVLTKTLVRDLMDDLAAPGGLTYEKVEGLTVDLNGNAYIVNDNDGVDDNSGEIQLINLGDILN